MSPYYHLAVYQYIARMGNKLSWLKKQEQTCCKEHCRINPKPRPAWMGHLTRSYMFSSFWEFPLSVHQKKYSEEPLVLPFAWMGETGPALVSWLCCSKSPGTWRPKQQVYCPSVLEVRHLTLGSLEQNQWAPCLSAYSDHLLCPFLECNILSVVVFLCILGVDWCVVSPVSFTV